MTVLTLRIAVSLLEVFVDGRNTRTRTMPTCRLDDSKVEPREDVIQIESPNRLQPALLLCSARPDGLEVTVRNSKEIG